MRKTRTYTKQEKQQIIDECLAVKNMAVVAKKNNIPIGTVSTWMKDLKSNKNIPLESDYHKKLKKQNEELQLENNILKDLLKKTVQILT